MRWLALGYNVPINPSKNRVYIWRKLKEFGAEYFKQGVAVLPYTKQSYSQFKSLSQKIKDMGGDASIVELKFIDNEDDLDMVTKFKAQYFNELSALKEDCLAVIHDIYAKTGTAIEDYQAEKIKKMVRQFNKTKQRNHFDSSLIKDIELSLYKITDIVMDNSNDATSSLISYINKQLKK